MKKQLMLAASMLFCGIVALAQPQASGAPVRLAAAPQGLMAPIWSPDGSKIAATGDNYTGIVVMNADGTQALSITTAEGAGYKMTWTPDGKEIIGRTNIRENNRVLHEIKAWSVDGSATRVIRAKARNNASPTLRAAGLSKSGAGVYEIMTTDPAGAASRIAALSDFAREVVINPALSPDGSRVAFQIPGKGMWIINSDGTGLKSLGKGSNPSWLPDSKNLVYTVVSDNGRNYTGSVVYGLNVESGNTSVVLSSSNLIPVTPAVSPDGKKVVFQNAADASLYIINLK